MMTVTSIGYGDITPTTTGEHVAGGIQLWMHPAVTALGDIQKGHPPLVGLLKEVLQHLRSGGIPAAVRGQNDTPQIWPLKGLAQQIQRHARIE